jgi:competence protein ComEA
MRLGLIFGISLVIILVVTGPGIYAQAKPPLVDLNTASTPELESLKGIGPATAKKIIEARPYTSVNDLTRAGLTPKNIEALKPFVTVSPAKASTPPAAAVPAKPVKSPEPAKLIDLNTASQQELESLPDIGKSSARKIIAGRPYTTVDNLTKAGIPAKNIDVLKPLVTISPVKEAPSPGEAPKKQVKAAEPAKIIDLNTASQQELESLPDIGKSSARKIIAGRPYSSVDDLAKSGLNAKTVAAIKPLVTVSAAQPKAAAPVTPAKTTPSPTPATPATTAPPPAGASPKGATAGKLAPGQTVNLNTASKEMLEALPEIGPVKAQAIINNRPYQKIEDIMKVKGIKEGTFSKIKDRITVN